jgi:hypothetical protein
VKRALRPRPSLAQRFVDWYVARLGQASKPIARMRTLFVLATASFFVHFIGVYGAYLLEDPADKLARIHELEPEHTDRTHVSLRPPEDPAKVMRDLLATMKALEKVTKQLEPEPKKEEPKKEEPKKEEPKKEPEKTPPKDVKKPEPPKAEEPKPAPSIAPKAQDDKDVKRKVLDVTDEDKKNAKKDAPNVGGETKNDQGVKKAAPDPEKAIVGVLKNPAKVDEKPDPAKVAKTPDELKPTKPADDTFAVKPKVAPPKPTEPPKPLAPAAPEGDVKPKELVDLNKEHEFKNLHPGKSPEKRDGQTGKKPPADVQPKPVEKPKPTPPPAPVTPPTPPPPAPAPPPEPSVQQQLAMDAQKLKDLVGNDPPPPSGEEGDNAPPPTPAPEVKLQPVVPPPAPPAPPAPKPAPMPPAPKPLPRPPAPAPVPAPSNVGVGAAPPPAPPRPVVAPHPQPPAPPRPAPAPAAPPAPPAPPAAPRPSPATPQVARLRPPTVNPNGTKPGAPGPRTANTSNVPGKAPPSAPMADPRNPGTTSKSGATVAKQNNLNPPRRTDQVVSRDQTVKQRDEVVNKNLHEMDDAIMYELEGGPDPKDAVPGIFIANTSEEEWKDIIGHFDLCPIAYPDTKDYFVLIDLVRQTLQKAKGEQAFNDLKVRYAASGIAFSKRKLWATSVFSGAAALACQQYEIPRSEVNLMILAPKQVMSYMTWKSIKTIKDMGFEPAKVRACHASFRRTTDGWILDVTDLVLEDGTVRKVRT